MNNQQEIDQAVREVRGDDPFHKAVNSAMVVRDNMEIKVEPVKKPTSAEVCLAVTLALSEDGDKFQFGCDEGVMPTRTYRVVCAAIQKAYDEAASDGK